MSTGETLEQAILDQSHHMVNLCVTGPDAARLLCEHGVNTFQDFAPGMAKWRHRCRRFV